STVIRLRIPPRQSTRLTSPTLILTAADAKDIILQDTIQLSIAKHKIHDELKAKENVEKVEEHLINEEIEKLGLIMERQQSQADVAKMIVDVIQQERKNIWAEISSQINNANTNHIPFQVDSSVSNYMSSHILHIHPTQASQAFAHEQQYQLYLTMKDNPQLQHDDLPIWLALKIKFERLQDSNTPCQNSTIRLRDHDDPHDYAHPKAGNSAKRHQYHIDQMQNFLKNNIVWESRKEILSLPFPHKPTLVVQSCQRDPKAPALSLINQDLLYPKKGKSGSGKIVLSLHKFSAVIFPDDEIEERTSRWVDKCVKKFNPYARYNVEHRKNPHAKIFYIKRQKEPGKLKEEIYSNSKIVQIIKTYGELGHEHKFITEIIAKIANGSIVSITKPDYKNLNKNDIEDIYLLIVNVKLGVESYQQKVNLIAPTINFHGIEKYKMFSIVFKPVYGIIYKNNKKENRVMRHQEVHKFCDATLKRVLEGSKSHNNDVKHGYVTPSLGKEDDEYLQLFEEEIEEWLKHRD
ncbi:hypothetical protein Tco_0421202, partial [Tanacetum coccineum]